MGPAQETACMYDPYANVKLDLLGLLEPSGHSQLWVPMTGYQGSVKEKEKVSGSPLSQLLPGQSKKCNLKEPFS